MRRALLAISALIAAGCVPASESLPPKGGVAFLSVPSGPTRGEPFATRDGWTVRIETLVLATSYGARYSEGHSTNEGEGSDWRFLASTPPQGVIRALDIRSTIAEIHLSALSVARCEQTRGPCVHDQDVDASLKRRFEEPADGEMPPDCTHGEGGCATSTWEYSHETPGFYVKGIATKGDRTIRFDLALSLATASQPLSVPVMIVPDEFVVQRVAIRAEELFRNANGDLVFNDFAHADSDGDGILTAYELKRTNGLFQPSSSDRFARIERRSALVGEDNAEHIPGLTEPVRPFVMLEVVCERSAKILRLVP